MSVYLPPRISQNPWALRLIVSRMYMRRLNKLIFVYCRVFKRSVSQIGQNIAFGVLVYYASVLKLEAVRGTFVI